jgi:hypothetical protein
MRLQHALSRGPQRKADADPFGRRFPTQDLRHRLIHHFDPPRVQDHVQISRLKGSAITERRTHSSQGPDSDKPSLRGQTWELHTNF